MTKKFPHSFFLFTKTLLVVICVCFSTIGFGQKTAEEYIKEGQVEIDAGNPYLAERIFEKAAKTYPNDLISNYLYGKTLLLINEYDAASDALLNALNLDVNDSIPEIIEMLARAQKSAGKLHSALNTYENIYSSTLNKPKSSLHKKAAKEVATIKRIIDGQFKGIETPYKNLKEINTDESDFAPFYLPNKELVYSSSVGVFSYFKDIQINQYSATYKGNDWKKNKQLPKTVNKPGALSANGILSPDSTTYYFTICNTEGDCNIYQMPFLKGKYGIARPLKLFDEKTYCTHPFPFIKNGKEGLLFTAQHDSGFGGLDIYVAWKNEDDKYGVARNLGAYINSSEDEITPFYVPERNVLFLSSTWHGGIGENDIFYTYTPDLELFTQLINLKKPFNSSANDSYFKLNDSLTTGLMVSNREGGKKNRYKTCCNDIYEFDYPFDSIHSDYDALMAQLLDTISYVEDEKEPLNLDLLVDSLRDLLPIPLYFHNDRPNPKTTQRTTAINYQEAYDNYMALRNEYLEINNTPLVQQFFDSLMPQSLQQFDHFLSLLKRLYQLTPYPIVMAVRGYASPLAKSDYNIYLSERRINSVQNYFYNSGFEKNDTINTVGWVINPYGESEADKSVSDNYYDTKNSVYSIGAMMERRVEMQWLQLDKSRIIKDTNALANENEKVKSLFYPLGRIEKNGTKKAVIALYNPYKEVMDIAEVRTSCACTEVHLEKFNIKKEGSIPVELEITGPDKIGEYALEIMFYPAQAHLKPIRVVLGLEAVK